MVKTKGSSFMGGSCPHCGAPSNDHHESCPSARKEIRQLHFARIKDRVKGQGWHGDTPGHEKAALKGQAGKAMNNPMLKEAIKPERFEPPLQTTSCQICARPIKASKGVIAHHGYKRPGGGWQTASCAGARFLPYEVSCDRLPPTIEFIKKHIMMVETKLNDFINNPPEKLIVQVGGYYNRSTKEVIRPQTFDPKNPPCCVGMYSYEGEFSDIRRKYIQDIKISKIDLQFMEDRLSKWVPLRRV